LLVEDNQTDAFVIREVLQESGIPHELHLAGNGERALTLLGLLSAGPALDVDLVLLDLNVPRVGGLEVLARMRADERYRHLPVVVVTSSDAQNDKDAVSALSGNAYFRKPSTLTDFMRLAEVIRQVLPIGDKG
jgi:CheY-like chemotaxis protein